MSRMTGAVSGEHGVGDVDAETPSTSSVICVPTMRSVTRLVPLVKVGSANEPSCRLAEAVPARQRPRRAPLRRSRPRSAFARKPPASRPRTPPLLPIPGMVIRTSAATS